MGQYGRYIPNTNENKVACGVTLIITSVNPKTYSGFLKKYRISFT